MVIFSIFRTDFKRVSISRRVAMFRAPTGAAPSTEGCTMRPRVCLASIVANVEESVVEDVRDSAEAVLWQSAGRRSNNSRPAELALNPI